MHATELAAAPPRRAASRRRAVRIRTARQDFRPAPGRGAVAGRPGVAQVGPGPGAAEFYNVKFKFYMYSFSC